MMDPDHPGYSDEGYKNPAFEDPPSGARLRRESEEAVMEALRERILTELSNHSWYEVADHPHWREKVADILAAVLALPEPEARQPEAARPPEPGEAP